MINVMDSRKRLDAKDSEQNLRHLMFNYKYDAVVTDVDTAYGDRYTVDIYELGYLKDPTRTDIIAHSTNVGDVYDVDDFVRVQLLDSNQTCVIVSEKRDQLVKVVATGPNGEANFTTNQYWGQFAYVSNTDSDPNSTIHFTAYNATTDFAPIVSFTNSREDASTHTDLKNGDFVYIKWEYDQHSPTPNRRWIREAGAPSGGAVFLTGTLAFNWLAGTNTVTIDPGGGASNITCYIQFPTTKGPPCFNAVAGDSLLYTKISSGLYVLISPPILPIPTAQWQTFIWNGTRAIWDWVRVHT